MGFEIEKKEEGMPAEVLVREGKQLVKTETQFQTAIVVQKARDITRIQAALLKEADLAGEAFYYSWPVKIKGGGRGIVEGPSIQLAVSAARLFGNCVWTAEYAEDEDRYYMKGHFVDLETGFNVMRPFRQRKAPDIGGGYDEDRKQDIAFQIGVSKAMRNVIVRGGLPQWLIEQAMNQAKHASVKRFEGLWKNKKDREEVINKALAEFDRIEVKLPQIETLLGLRKNWTPQIMAQLYGMFQAIKDGQSTVGEIFGGEVPEYDAESEKEFWKKVESERVSTKELMEEYIEQFTKLMGFSKGKFIERALVGWNDFVSQFNEWGKKRPETPQTGKKQGRSEEGEGESKGDEEKDDPGATSKALKEGMGEPGVEALTEKVRKKMVELMPQKVMNVTKEAHVISLTPDKLTDEKANRLLEMLSKVEVDKDGKGKITVDKWMEWLREVGTI